MDVFYDKSILSINVIIIIIYFIFIKINFLRWKIISKWHWVCIFMTIRQSIFLQWMQNEYLLWFLFNDMKTAPFIVRKTLILNPLEYNVWQRMYQTESLWKNKYEICNIYYTSCLLSSLYICKSWKINYER